MVPRLISAPSASTELNCRGESLPLDAGVLRGEAPLTPAFGDLAVAFPGRHRRGAGVGSGNPPAHTWRGQDAAFGCGHGQPAAMRGGVMPLQPFQPSAGRGGGNAAYRDAGVGGFRWSRTSTIVSAGGSCASTTSRSRAAQSTAVRRSVTLTGRFPASGATSLHSWAVPRRAASESTRGGGPGVAGMGVRGSATCGRWGASGRVYTSSPASMGQTKAACAGGGLTDGLCRHG